MNRSPVELLQKQEVNNPDDIVQSLSSYDLVCLQYLGYYVYVVEKYFKDLVWGLRYFLHEVR